VLIVQGSVAAAWFPGKPPPVDALIIGSIDEQAGGTPEAGKPAGRGGAKHGTSRARTGRSRS
jgi:ethanolamine utilization protein EutN